MHLTEQLAERLHNAGAWNGSMTWSVLKFVVDDRSLRGGSPLQSRSHHGSHQGDQQYDEDKVRDSKYDEE